MKDSFHFTPERGRIVRDPASGERIPTEGRLVPNTSFWNRRVADGDGRRATRSPAGAKPKKQEG